jgi:hypothetical protein
MKVCNLGELIVAKSNGFAVRRVSLEVAQMEVAPANHPSEAVSSFENA